MPTTQYIGARYVPLIYQNPDDNSNDWKAGVAYEPLTIVSYAGGSYTSKQHVPASVGNPIDNPSYWVAIGLYSGQTAINTNSIIQIRHALCAQSEAGNVATADHAVGEYIWIEGVLYRTTAAITTGDSYVDGVNITEEDDFIANVVTAITNIGSDISTIQGDITDLGDYIDTVAGYRDFTTRKIMCISDSYGLVPSTSDSWIGKLQNYLAIPNANFYRSQVNASGFVGLVPDTFKVQMQNLAGSMTADEKDALTDLIIGGGINDATALKNGTTPSDLSTAISDALIYARSTFPNAIIYLFMPGWNIDGTTHHYIVATQNLYQQQLTAATKACYIDGVNWLHRLALLDSTKYHPNSVGSYCIAKSIASVLAGGSAFCDLAPDSTSGFITPYLTASASITDLTFSGVKQLYANGFASMFWQNIKFKPVSTLWLGGTVEIGEFTDGIMSGGNFLEGYSAQTPKGILTIYGNKLRFTNTSADIAANTEVELNMGSMHGPIML